MCTMRYKNRVQKKQLFSTFFFFKQLNGIELTSLLYNIWKLYPINKLNPEFYKNYTAVRWFLNKTIDRTIVTQDIKEMN